MKSPNSSDLDVDEPPDCAAARQSMQHRLDGNAESESDEVIVHRANCPSCQSVEAASRLLEKGILKTAPPNPPIDLADRIMAAWKAEPFRKRRRVARYVAGAMALAASVCFVVVLIKPVQEPKPISKSVVEQKQEPGSLERKSPVSINDSLDEAGSAVAMLTRKTTDEMLNIRLPSLPLPDVSAVNPMGRLEPAVDSMQEIQHGAVDGMAPIANTTKRAIDMIWREISPDMDRKPATN